MRARTGRPKDYLGGGDVLVAPEDARNSALGLCMRPEEVPAAGSTERRVLEVVGRAGRAGALLCQLPELLAEVGVKLNRSNASRLVKELEARNLVCARQCTYDPDHRKSEEGEEEEEEEEEEEGEGGGQEGG